MLSLDKLDRLIIELLKVSECLFKKVPSRILDRGIRVNAGDEAFVLDIYSAEAETRHIISVYEILHILEKVIPLRFTPVNGDTGQNIIDKLITGIIARFIDNAKSEKYNGPDMPVPVRADEQLREFLTAHFRKLLDEERSAVADIERESDHIFNRLAMKKITTADGYDLNYYTYGAEHQPALILITAYGIPVEIWKYVIRHFSGRYRIITWETRGSLPSHDGMPLDAHLHAGDLYSIVQAEKVYEADFICWCSGFKIMAEYYRVYPDTVRTISVICGYFNPLGPETAYWTGFDKTIGKLSDLLVKDRQLIDSPFIIQMIEKLFSFDIREKMTQGMRKENEDTLLFNLISSPVPEIKPLITAPFKTRETLLNYARITLELQKHDTSDVLALFNCPVLIINAGFDIISDIRCAPAAASDIKNCRYELLEYSTHWCLWDDHSNVNRLIDQFLSGARAQMGQEER